MNADALHTADRKVPLRTLRTHSRRAVLCGVAGSLALFGIVTAPIAGAVADVATDRYAGSDRYATAAAVAGQADFTSATTAILATGETFPDALAAAGLAGANAPAPIVLTASTAYSSAAKRALGELDSLTDVIIVGGTAAISTSVEAAVAADGYGVTRLAGANRYETAAAIAREIGAARVGAIDALKTAIIANGDGFADALAGGPLAYARRMPILLVSRDAVPAATEDALDDLGIQQTVILGGTNAVSDAVASTLTAITGNPARRVAGQNRFGTAAAAADFGVAELAWGPTQVLLASGLTFPDALSAGALGGQRQAPILLLASVPQETSSFLRAHTATITTVACVGGTSACSAADLTAAETASESPPASPTEPGIVTSALKGPELQRVRKTGTDLDDLAVAYTFTFDEVVDDDSVSGSGFSLYNADSRNPADGDRYHGDGDIEVSGRSVVVTFNLADYGVVDATLGSVEQGAVTDDDGNENPAQSLAVDSGTDEPDRGLLRVAITDADDGIATFTFATPQVPGLTEALEYQLIERDGTVHTVDELAGDGTSETSPDDEKPSTVVRVDFDTDLSDATLRRAVVITSSELDVDDEDVRIDAVDIASSGNTDTPDLVSIKLPSDERKLDDDEALFIFDEAVEDVGSSPDSFALIYSHCDPSAPTSVNELVADLGRGSAQAGVGYDDDVAHASTCAIRGTAVEIDAAVHTRGVIVTFATELIDTEFLIGGQVDDDAGVEDDDGDTNLNDEVQYSTAEELFDAGSSAGPLLVSAVATTNTRSSGAFSNYRVTFRFDKDLDDDLDLTDGFRFFSNDGDDVDDDEFDADDCTYRASNTVVCEITDEDSEIVEARVVAVDGGVVQTDDEFHLDEDETDVSFPNPPRSIPFDPPEAP